MVKPANQESIERATGILWAEWVEMLDEMNGRELGHAEIAKLAHDQLESKIDSPGWWAQGVAVAYEQHIGRRAPGQRSDGTFEASVTKTVQMAKEETFARLSAKLDALTVIQDVTLSDHRTSSTSIRHYWKATGSDGSKTIIGVEQRSNKSLVAVQVQRLTGTERQQFYKDFWRDFLTRTFEEV